MPAPVLSRRDLDFLLYDWLDVVSLTGRPYFAEHSRETFDGILDLSADLATKHFATHNKKADAEEPRIGEDGRVGGKASCNSYGASYTVGGEGVTFGQSQSTLMACAEPLMAQEAAFLGTLREVRRFDVDASAALVLSTDDGRTIRATR